MTRYGLAIKALPKGAKPFGDDEEQDQDTPDAETTEADAPPVAPDANAAVATPAKEAEDVNPLAVEESATEEVPDKTVQPPRDPAAASQDAGAAPVAEPEDDGRPWSGDMYDEGDETEPANAFAAYRGADGEEAWLSIRPQTARLPGGSAMPPARCGGTRTRMSGPSTLMMDDGRASAVGEDSD
ncbi:hypothetical protein AB0C93_27165 [Streptomyces sp. NPDC048518]|uniref:hypothetical protein n=1 Tax=Streptomyces sp. NPDC048518 TaxID=3155029 RepID=UPI00340C6B9C